MTLQQYLHANIFNQPIYQHLQNDFDHWYELLCQKIAFHFDSHLHGINHCGRVLLYALILADELGLDDKSKTILCHTAVFHDSKRFDDGYDIGHGKRGADYYKDYCQKHELPFYVESYWASYYHDLPDDIGMNEIPKQSDNNKNALFLYRLFKDADALDRYRLGLDALDKKFLRIDESKQLAEFGKQLVLATEDDVSNSISELKGLLNV